MLFKFWLPKISIGQLVEESTRHWSERW